jgi:hypothetical protein
VKRTIKLKFFGKEALKGGLNVSDNPVIVPPNQMVVAKNVAISQTLARKKRSGLQRYTTGSFIPTGSYTPSASYPFVANPATSLSAIRGIYQYFRYGSANGEPYVDLFLNQEDKVWSIPDRTNPALNRTGALSLSATAIPSYQVFEGILYWADSEQNYYKWNGLDAVPSDAEAATPPADGPGQYLRAHQGKMWMAGNTLYPFRLYYSTTFDADDWTSANPSNGGSLDLEYDGDPEGITAIFPPFQGRLYVATRRRIYEITGVDASDFQVRPITNGIGCVSHNSVVAIPNDILFCSDRGIHSLRRLQVSDQSEVTFLSRDIQPLWVYLINRSLLNRTWGVFDETTNSYIITCVGSGKTENNVTLVYNIEFDTWTTWEDLDARSVTLLLQSGQTFLLCGREDGEIAYLDPGKNYDLDDTAGYAMQFKTGKLYPGDEIDTQFRVHSVTILASTTRASNIGVSWSLDSIDGQRSGNKSISLGDDSSVLGTTFVLGQSTLGFGQFLPQKITVDQVGYNFQLGIVASGTNDIEFYGFILEVSNEDTHFA